jgi:hypothetical protein
MTLPPTGPDPTRTDLLWYKVTAAVKVGRGGGGADRCIARRTAAARRRPPPATATAARRRFA